MWYRFEEGNPIGIPRVKEYQVAFYDMMRGGSCFDESFFEPDEINKVMPFVETVEDKVEDIRSKVFVHFDDGDIYELKLEKINKHEECNEDDEFDDYDDYDYDPYEDETMKFIWGVKSWDCLSPSDANLYTMNDIDIIYNKGNGMYMLSIETAYFFETHAAECEYLQDCLKAFTKYMDDNGLNKNEPYRLWMSNHCTNMEAQTIEELYTNFKIFVDGFCNQDIDMDEERY